MLGLQDEVQAAGQREKTYHYSAQKREESRVSQMQRQIRPQGNILCCYLCTPSWRPAPGQPSSNENEMAVWCVLMSDELDYINGGTQDSIGSVAR